MNRPALINLVFKILIPWPMKKFETMTVSRMRIVRDSLLVDSASSLRSFKVSAGFTSSLELTKLTNKVANANLNIKFWFIFKIF